PPVGGGAFQEVTEPPRPSRLLGAVAGGIGGGPRRRRDRVRLVRPGTAGGGPADGVAGRPRDGDRRRLARGPLRRAARVVPESATDDQRRRWSQCPSEE